MNITFVISRNRELSGIPDNLSLQLSQAADKLVQVDDCAQGIQKILTVCAENMPETVVLTAEDPLRFRDSRQHGLMQGLIDLGMNPASIAFVNLHGIRICDENENEYMQRLAFCTQLARDQASLSQPLLKKKINPVQRCLFVGDVPEKDICKLQAHNIELVSIWAHHTGQAIRETELESIYGLPGKYRVQLLRHGETMENFTCGAMLINGKSLDEAQKKQLASIFKIPFSGGMFRLPSARHAWTWGIRLVEDGNATEQIISLLSKETNIFYLDACSVDFSKCGLCGTCVKTCMFSANSIDPQTNKLVFDPNRCTGCGNCVTACPVLARDLHSYSNDYMGSITPGLQKFQGRNRIKILALYCENNGYRAINNLAAAGQQISASYFFLPVKCGARIGTEIIPDSFQAGFDGVALLVCARDECNNLVGSLDLERRFNLYRTIMKAQGQESGRLRIFSIKENELDNVHVGLDQFVDYLKELQADQAVFAGM